MYKISFRSLLETHTDWLNYAARFCFQLSLLIGIITIASWILGFRIVLSIYPNYVPINPETSIIIIIMSFILLVNTFHNQRFHFKKISWIFLLLITFYTFLKLLEPVVGFDLTFKKQIFTQTEYMGNFPINQISPYSSFIFFIQCISGLYILTGHGHSKYYHVISILGVLAIFFSSVIIAGYSFGSPLFYSGNLIPISLPAAAAMFITSTGIIVSAGPKSFINKLFTGNSIKVLVLRSFLPIIIIILLTAGFMHDTIDSLMTINHSLLASVITLVFILITLFITYKIAGKLSNVVDKTEIKRKEAEQLLIENLKEKETLLKELNHRVKNNFNLINSLIELSINSKSGENEFRDSVNVIKQRIFAISLIHKQLYDSKSFSDINFKEYIIKITNDLLLAYKDNKNINIMYDLEEIPLQITKAIPCGLIINELFINSFKYAFSNKDSGNIHISFKRYGREVVLSVRDDGIGLPQEFNPESGKTLGYTIIKELSRQIDGKYEINSENGAYFQIKFLEK